MTEEPPTTSSKPGAVFWTTAVLGWAVIAWGVAGVVRHHVDTRPADLLRFVAGGISSTTWSSSRWPWRAPTS